MAFLARLAGPLLNVGKNLLGGVLGGLFGGGGKSSSPSGTGIMSNLAQTGAGVLGNALNNFSTTGSFMPAGGGPSIGQQFTGAIDATKRAISDTANNFRNQVVPGMVAYGANTLTQGIGNTANELTRYSMGGGFNPSNIVNPIMGNANNALDFTKQWAMESANRINPVYNFQRAGN